MKLSKAVVLFELWTTSMINDATKQKYVKLFSLVYYF